MSATATRVKIKVPSAAEVAARQQREDERANLVSASKVRYSAGSDSIRLHMLSGFEVIIPRRLIEELDEVPRSVLSKELTLGIGGDAISVPSYDIDIAVAGLLRDLVGSNIQRIGGRARTAAKAAAARANGRKGGRPRNTSAGV
jgi:hypothetical protein